MSCGVSINLTGQMVSFGRVNSGLTNLCALENLQDEIGGMTSLKKIDTCEYEVLQELPVGLTNLSPLQELDFLKCQYLRKILEGFNGVSSRVMQIP